MHRPPSAANLAGLLKGKTIAIDATTLEANAAMRSIVRRDTGETYQEFLTQLAKASGVETPTREDCRSGGKSFCQCDSPEFDAPGPGIGAGANCRELRG